MLRLGFDSHGSAITPLIYSKHEISDCDRRCCQNMKHTLGGHVGCIRVCSPLSESGPGG